MISVQAALDALFALVQKPNVETVDLTKAMGRVLARPMKASRDQPPFDAAAMDGYAIAQPAAKRGDSYQVIGEAAAGRRFEGDLTPDTAVRIFTGAPVPAGTSAIIIQENAIRIADRIELSEDPNAQSHIRPAGNDFKTGSCLDAPKRLNAADIALLASMNMAQIPVYKRPTIALLSTGDELVMPGEQPGPDQILASNTYGLAALLNSHGADCRILPIARDTRASLKATFALAAGSDIVLTIGGASVGDHDLVAQVAADIGIKQSFYKIAMRPGKPLMAGAWDDTIMIGLPGNPVSALVCGHIFVIPVVNALLGLPRSAQIRQSAPLAQDVAANGPREHYMRAKFHEGRVHVFERQDSALLSVLAKANILAIRPAFAAPAKQGDRIEYIPL